MIEVVLAHGPAVIEVFGLLGLTVVEPLVASALTGVGALAALVLAMIEVLGPLRLLVVETLVASALTGVGALIPVVLVLLEVL